MRAAIICIFLSSPLLIQEEAIAQSFDNHQPPAGPFEVQSSARSFDVQQQPTRSAANLQRSVSRVQQYATPAQPPRIANSRYVAPKDMERQNEWRNLQRDLHATDDAEKRQEISEQMKDLLEEAFVEDLSQRDSELSKLEARVKQLRDAIEKRRKNQNRIIELQIETQLLSAEGLSFPGSFQLDTTSPPVQAFSARSLPGSFPSGVPRPQTQGFSARRSQPDGPSNPGVPTIQQDNWTNDFREPQAQTAEPQRPAGPERIRDNRLQRDQRPRLTPQRDVNREGDDFNSSPFEPVPAENRR